MKRLLLLLSVLPQLLLSAEIPAVSVGDDGELVIGGISAALVHFDPRFVSTRLATAAFRPDPGYPRRDGDSQRTRGRWLLKQGAFELEQTVTRTGQGWRVAFSWSSPDPVLTGDMGLELRLPADRFSGREVRSGTSAVTLPYEYSPAPLLPGASGETIVSVESFRLHCSGASGILLQDNRRYGHDDFALRLRPETANGGIDSGKLELEFRFLPCRSRPVPLGRAANFAFTDPVAGDGKGGWSDQGPENDLRDFKTGQQEFGGVNFNIGGCLVFGGARLPKLSASAQIPAPRLVMPYLNVLHAAAFTPGAGTVIGTVRALYADGSVQEFPIKVGVDVNDWHYPKPAANASVAWEGENPSAPVGLFQSVFPLEAKPLQSVELSGAGNAMWMIAGLAVSDFRPRSPDVRALPFVVEESAHWRPIPVPREIASESILDFSGLLDGPAGKYGRVVVRNGKFEFEQRPGEAVRFYGTNLYFDACFPEPADAERMAELLARSGYNSIRLHHYDRKLIDPSDPSGVRPDPAQMEKLDYLFKCLKERGIYVTLDLHCLRVLRDEAGREREIQEAKLAILLEESSYCNLRDFSLRLLNHVNPHTGLAWKDDPALAFISLINENALTYIAREYARMPQQGKALFRRHFDAWRKSRPAGGSEAGAEQMYIAELHNGFYRKFTAELRAAGVRTPFTDQNNINRELAIAPMRGLYDYVDSHPYHAHPSFIGKAWGYPMRIPPLSDIRAMGKSLRGIFPLRIFGKPFIISEFNYSFPNPARAEGGALAGAYAALQDWDGVFRFGFAERPSQLHRETPPDLFHSIDEPMQALSDRLAMLLFLRRDVRPATAKLAIGVTPETPMLERDGRWTRYADFQSLAGLVVQVGTTLGPTRFPADLGETEFFSRSRIVFPPGMLDRDRGFARSSTGELTLDRADGSFRIATARTAAIVLLKKGNASAGELTVDNAGDFCLVSASAMDGAGLAESKRILVLHLTNVLSSGMKFRDRSMSILETRGKVPSLVRRGEAGVRLALAPGAEPAVYGCDLTGRRIEKVNSVFSPDGQLQFQADTFQLQVPCLVYEIVRP